MVRREAARKAALAAFVPPQPQATVQGAVLPLQKKDKAELHPELHPGVPAAAASSSPTELASVPAAAPKRELPQKAKGGSDASSSQVKRRKKVAMDKAQKATKRPMPPSPSQGEHRQQLDVQLQPSPSLGRHMQRRALVAGKLVRKRFLVQLASLFSRRSRHDCWQPGFLQQKLLYNVLWWLRRHHLPPEFCTDVGQPCRSPRQDELWASAYGCVLEVSSQMGISVHDNPRFSHSRFRTNVCDAVPKGTRLAVQEAKLGWIRVTYAECAQHALWVRFTSQQQYNSNYSPYGEFFNDFANCFQEEPQWLRELELRYSASNG